MFGAEVHSAKRKREDHVFKEQKYYLAWTWRVMKRKMGQLSRGLATDQIKKLFSKTESAKDKH